MAPRNKPATVEDLYQLPDGVKAEVVRGEVVVMSPSGDLPNRAAGAIYVSLRLHEQRVTGAGRAYTDNAGFKVALPHRDSFSPDAAFYVGPRTGGKFLDGAPVFAAEVRNRFGLCCSRSAALRPSRVASS